MGAYGLMSQPTNQLSPRQPMPDDNLLLSFATAAARLLYGDDGGDGDDGEESDGRVYATDDGLQLDTSSSSGTYTTTTYDPSSYGRSVTFNSSNIRNPFSERRPTDTTMPPTQASDELLVGPEVEYPVAPSDQTTMTNAGHSSSELKNEWYSNHGERWDVGGQMTHDGTVGAEIVAPGPSSSRGLLTASEAPEWYADTIELAESLGYPHEPTGLMAQNEGSTAGLHIHLSHITEEAARSLFEVSQEPWMQLFACTSLATNGTGRVNFKVFRGGSYCTTDNFDTGRYAAVHAVRRSEGHYEWRLPEPMTPQHFELLMEFLDRWHQDRADAYDWARDLVESADERITAFQRADACGVLTQLEDARIDPVISRTPADGSETFFWEVFESPSAPYIYNVELDDGAYYVLYSPDEGRDGDSTYEAQDSGVEFTSGSVLDADSLAPASNIPRDELWEVLENPAILNSDGPRTTDATELLTDVMS